MDSAKQDQIGSGSTNPAQGFVGPSTVNADMRWMETLAGGTTEHHEEAIQGSLLREPLPPIRRPTPITTGVDEPNGNNAHTTFEDYIANSADGFTRVLSLVGRETIVNHIIGNVEIKVGDELDHHLNVLAKLVLRIASQQTIDKVRLDDIEVPAPTVRGQIDEALDSLCRWTKKMGDHDEAGSSSPNAPINPTEVPAEERLGETSFGVVVKDHTDLMDQMETSRASVLRGESLAGGFMVDTRRSSGELDSVAGWTSVEGGDNSSDRPPPFSGLGASPRSQSNRSRTLGMRSNTESPIPEISERSFLAASERLARLALSSNNPYSARGYAASHTYPAASSSQPSGSHMNEPLVRPACTRNTAYEPSMSSIPSSSSSQLSRWGLQERPRCPTNNPYGPQSRLTDPNHFGE